MAMPQPLFSLGQEVLLYTELENGTFVDEGIVIGMVWNADFSLIPECWCYWIEYTIINSLDDYKLPQFSMVSRE